MKSSNIPCLILGYARIEGLLSVLRSAISSGSPRIYISIDGTDDSDIKAIQNELVEQVNTISAATSAVITLRRSQKNLGVAAGVISGIDWFFENEDFGIILEDDLCVGKDFFSFIELSRTNFDSSDNYWMIAGSRFSPNRVNMTLTNYPLIWGWATSKLKWGLMRAAIVEGVVSRITLSPESNFWIAGSLRVKFGFIDTWDIPLVSAMKAQDKFCLLPPVNLISNVGDDSVAVHTKISQFPMKHPIGQFNFEALSSLTVDLRETSNENLFLRNKVYQIKPRHLLSVAKFYVQRIFQVSKYDPLATRVGSIREI